MTLTGECSYCTVELYADTDNGLIMLLVETSLTLRHVYTFWAQ